MAVETGGAAGGAGAFSWPSPTDGIYDGGLPVEEVLGLPLHPLIVHAAVVLLPLAALGMIITGLSQKRAKAYGGVVAILAAGAAVSALLAMLSGRTLKEQLGYSDAQHFTAGGWLPWFGFALFGCALLLWLLDRKPKRALPAKIVAVLGIVVAVATIAATIYTGHLGAELSWSGRI